jgi:sugar O-acyltransferase (sialic acid O-acetyltransferase NeuD family)
MENKRILLVGGGGHCRSVVDSLLETDGNRELGIVEKPGTGEGDVFGISVVGTDDDLQKLFDDGWGFAFITLGGIGLSEKRRSLYSILQKIGYIFPAIIDKTAIISKHVEIHEGAFVGKNAVINAGSEIGICAIINSCAVVEHDCSVGAFSHISPGAILCGGVSIESGAHVGAGAVVRQQLSIGHNSIIGMGSVVTRDIPENVIAFGNPCKIEKKL